MTHAQWWTIREQTVFVKLHINHFNYRYGMMWPGVEPVKGEYNQTYIDAAKEIVTK